jgi:hypothetical protein
MGLGSGDGLGGGDGLGDGSGNFGFDPIAGADRAEGRM